MTARRALAIGLTVAAFMPAGCSNREPRSGEARLEVDGQAIVERRSGAEETIDGKTDLRSGDRVELSEGTGRMILRDGVRLELRAGLGDAADSMVRMALIPVLEAGDVLVTSPNRFELSAAGTGLVIEGGAAQVSRALGMGVSAYDGVARLDSAGVVRTVPALREMQVPALGRPPRQARPLDYRPNDPWDRRFLGEAIDLGRTLEALANGYTQNLNRGEGRTPGFFRLVLPGLDDEPEFRASLINLAKPPGETLIGAAITELGRRGSFVDRWQAVFDFRDAGAEWGLVALDQGVSGAPLLGSVEQAVSSSPLTFASGRLGGPGSRQPTSPDDQGPNPRQPTTTTVPTTPPTSPTTTVPPIEGPLAPVIDAVDEAADGLVGGLLGGQGPG